VPALPRPEGSQGTLNDLKPTAHCTREYRFHRELDQSVELTFTPNASVRSVPRVDYCVGAASHAHVVAQQSLAPASRASSRSPSRPAAIACARRGSPGSIVRVEAAGGAGSRAGLSSRSTNSSATSGITLEPSPLGERPHPDPLQQSARRANSTSIEKQPHRIEIQLSATSLSEPSVARMAN